MKNNGLKPLLCIKNLLFLNNMSPMIDNKILNCD